MRTVARQLGQRSRIVTIVTAIFLTLRRDTVTRRVSAFDFFHSSPLKTELHVESHKGRQSSNHLGVSCSPKLSWGNPMSKKTSRREFLGAAGIAAGAVTGMMAGASAEPAAAQAKQVFGQQKSAKLRQLLDRPGTFYCIAAFDAPSARLV